MNMQISDQQLILYALAAGGFVALCCIFVLSTLLVRRKFSQKKKEALFGSTVKINSYNAAASVKPSPFYIQPRKDGAQVPDSSSETDLSKIDSPTSQAGLSGYPNHSQRSSYDSATECRTVESGGEESEWRVWFKLQYDDASENLDITIYRAKCSLSFPSMPPFKSSVFFILYLLPDENNRQQTALYPNNGCPSFDETVSFKVQSNAIGRKRLRLSLYEMDATRTRMVLGHVIVKLDELHLEQGGIFYLCRNMQMRAALPASSLGDVHVSLSYDIQTEKLKVQVFAARDLPATKQKTKFYLQTNVIVGTRSVKSKRTETHTSLPGVFSCFYMFQLPCKHLDACCLHFSIKQINEESGTEMPYGYFLIGPCVFTHGTGLEHWKQMVGNTKKVVEMWHKILPYEESY